MIPCNAFYTPYSKLNVFPYKLEKNTHVSNISCVCFAIFFSTFDMF